MAKNKRRFRPNFGMLKQDELAFMKAISTIQLAQHFFGI
jgi:hypothetical protein